MERKKWNSKPKG